MKMGEDWDGKKSDEESDEKRKEKRSRGEIWMNSDNNNRKLF
jgi:hypothetical protein